MREASTPLPSPRLRRLRQMRRYVASDVMRELAVLWRDGLRPPRIAIRREMIVAGELPRIARRRRRGGAWPPPAPPTGAPDPIMARLIASRGLTMQLELLLLFEAQCRLPPGTDWSSDRPVRHKYAPRGTTWTHLLPTAVDDGAVDRYWDLVGRQITEALAVLDRLKLVDVPLTSGGSRKVEQFKLLEETGSKRPYTVPDPKAGDAVIWVPTAFFTNLWVFALSDTEIATYFMLLALRARFSLGHAGTGVFATVAMRENWFKLTGSTYYGNWILEAAGLVVCDRPGRPPDKDTAAARRAAGKLLAKRYKLEDQALQKPGIDVVTELIETSESMAHHGIGDPL